MALPGVHVELKDRFYTLSRTDTPTGPVIAVIATRNTANGTNGIADYDPYSATNEQDIITSYGTGSQAHRAYLELTASGANRIAIIALPMGTVDSDLTSTVSGNKFDAAFDAAEQAQPDIIVPWGRGGDPTEWETPATPSDDLPFGFYADNNVSASSSMVKRVADKVADITSRSNPCFAVLGVKPFVGSASASPSTATDSVTAANLATYLTFPNLPSRDDVAMGDTGPYVSVVATELKPRSYIPGWGYCNGATTYAAQLTNLSSWSASTGKNVVGVAGMRWTPTRAQAEAMSGKGLVPVNLDYNRNPVWVDGQTFSVSTSDYTRLSTLRIIFDAVQMVRQVAQKFVGEGASTEHRNSLETAISAGLRGMLQLGALTAADFSVSYAPRSNKAYVDLVLTPAFEIRDIEVSVSVNL